MKKNGQEYDRKPRSGIRCHNCSGYGHESRDCRKPKSYRTISAASFQGEVEKPKEAVVREMPEKKCCCKEEKLVSATCLIQPAEDIQHLTDCNCLESDYVKLACGKSIPLISSACIKQNPEAMKNMPVMKGKVFDTVVDTLRDSGSQGVVVKKQFVSEDHYTGQYGFMVLIDKSIRKVPTAKVQVDTPYFPGGVEAQVLPDAVCDLVIGNIPGARGPLDPDPDWNIDGKVTTRVQPKQEPPCPVCVPGTNKSIKVDNVKLSQMQSEDKTLGKFCPGQKPVVKGNATISIKKKNNILCRVYQNPKVNQGRENYQVIVPKPLRKQVMELAHNSIMGEHLGIKKTIDKVLSEFFWPGIHGDVARFCRYCNVRQQMFRKRRLKKMPLQRSWRHHQDSFSMSRRQVKRSFRLG